MKRGAVDVTWLGQAGFLLRGDRQAVAIDAYLSDDCAAIYGLERSAPAPVAATELVADVVLVTHWHEDHLDLPVIAAALGRGAAVIAPPSAVERIRGRGWRTGSLQAIVTGATLTVGDVTVTAVPARHEVAGFLTEDAVGYLIELDGVRVYHSGDTEYTRAIPDALASRLDVALVCMNGSGGNMNTLEAAALTAQLDSAVVVPMHFGLWAHEAYGPGATLDPAEFAETCRRLEVDAEVVVPALGPTPFLRVAGAAA